MLPEKHAEPDGTAALVSADRGFSSETLTWRGAYKKKVSAESRNPAVTLTSPASGEKKVSADGGYPAVTLNLS